MRILQVVFILGAVLGFYFVLRPYPLLDAGSSLLGLAGLFFCAGGVLFTAEKDERVNAKYVFAALVPWMFAGLLMANWQFDQSENISHQTVVIRTRYGRSWNVVVVKSWRSNRTEENLYLKSTLLPAPGPRFFLPGEAVTVSVRSGAIRMSWIRNISPNPYPRP